MSMELKVLENNHSFKWNYEPAKTFVTKSIKEYVGLVVSETNLAEMEKTQKEIAGLRIRLQKFRLSVKKEMEKPYEAFELQVNELAGLIESAEKPIKDQLQKYEDKRKEDKRTECENLIISVAAELKLEDKYRTQIVIDDKWINRGAKIKAIKEDIQMRVVYFLDQQKADKEAETFRQQKVEMAKFMIESLSKDLATPLTFADVEEIIESLNVGELRTYIENQVATRKEREERAAQLALEREEQKRITEVARQEREEQARIARKLKEEAEQASLAELYKDQQTEKEQRLQKEQISEGSQQELVSKLVELSQDVKPIESIKLYDAQFVAYGVNAEQIKKIATFFNSLGIKFKHSVKPVVIEEEEIDY